MAFIARLDYVSALNGQALSRVMVPLGVCCVLLVVAGLIARRRGGVGWGRRFAPALIGILNLPAALLFAPLLPPPTLLEYGLRIVGWMVGLTVICYLPACLLRLSPAVVAALIGSALVVGDTFAGQPLLKDSLLSGYPLSGIRYYGVGNEYLSVLLWFALAGGFAWLDDRGVPFPPEGSSRGLSWALGLLWLLLMLTLGWPGLGANAGSLAATGAGFGGGAALLLGKRPTIRLGVGCVLAGLLLAFAFGALDAALTSQEAGGSSHFGAAIQAASGGRGAGYLAEIAFRKVAMNLRLLASPWMVLGLSVLAAMLWLIRALVGETAHSVLAQRVWTTKGLAALLAAGVAALIFKDSGIVTATGMVGTASVIMLYYVQTTTGKDEG